MAQLLFAFNLRKAIQACGVIAEREQKRLEFIRLLKLLYIAERETLREIGGPIVGERYIAMRNGPLHDYVYAMVKGESIHSSQWNQYFERDGHYVRMIVDSGVEALSRFEVRKLHEVVDRYRNVDTWELVEMTHTFPEWQLAYPDPTENTSKQISADALLRGVGCSAEEVENIKHIASEAAGLDAVFG